MESVNQDTVLTADRPWVHFRNIENIENLAAIGPELSDIRIFALDGTKMASVDDIFDQYQREFEFPLYFGWNWPAFQECLTTLENTPARSYLTIIHNSASILPNDRSDLTTFLRVLSNTGSYWSNSLEAQAANRGRPVPFNTILLSQ